MKNLNAIFIFEIVCQWVKYKCTISFKKFKTVLSTFGPSVYCHIYVKSVGKENIYYVYATLHNILVIIIWRFTI